MMWETRCVYIFPNNHHHDTKVVNARPHECIIIPTTPSIGTKGCAASIFTSDTKYAGPTQSHWWKCLKVETHGLLEDNTMNANGAFLWD